MVEEVLRLSSSRRLFAPLAYLVGAFAMLLEGLRRLLHDWRLVPVEVLPAVWLWLALYDLRLHVLRGNSFHSAHEADLVAVSVLIVGVTMLALFLNVVFAFAVAGEGTPTVAESLRRGRRARPPDRARGRSGGGLPAGRRRDRGGAAFASVVHGVTRASRSAC